MAQANLGRSSIGLDSGLEVSTYQVEAHQTATTKDVDVHVLGLIGEAGSVASAVKKFRRDDPAEAQIRGEISEELGDVLWYVSEIASIFGLSLEEIAQQNLRKTRYLFQPSDANFDSLFPSNEAFPRKFEVTLDGNGRATSLLVDGVTIGDALTDNSYHEDGYRFHDAFHLSYAVHLGWSPVMRALLGKKRKSNPLVDEVEDGARARVLEEGIAILIFSQSQPASEFAPSLFASRTNIPIWLLENIKKMTSGLEVSSRSVGQWRTAISEGFQVFDQLRANGGGTVTCDLDARRLIYRAA